MENRRTRIVVTLGPATDTPKIIEAVLRAGADMARINFSHGTAEEHLARIDLLREASRSVQRPVAILADLPGPKLRVRLAAERELAIGQEIAFSRLAEPVQPDDLILTEPELLREIRPGHRILFDDGRLQLEAGLIAGDRLLARVTTGGTLLPNKGVNLPDTPLNIPALTDRDRQALEIAARAGQRREGFYAAALR